MHMGLSPIFLVQDLTYCLSHSRQDLHLLLENENIFSNYLTNFYINLVLLVRAPKTFVSVNFLKLRVAAIQVFLAAV